MLKASVLGEGRGLGYLRFVYTLKVEDFFFFWGGGGVFGLGLFKGIAGLHVEGVWGFRGLGSLKWHFEAGSSGLGLGFRIWGARLLGEGGL